MARLPKVKLSPKGQELLESCSVSQRIFNNLQVAGSMLYRRPDEVARNGALQRINFGQRFS